MIYYALDAISIKKCKVNERDLSSSISLGLQQGRQCQEATDRCSSHFSSCFCAKLFLHKSKAMAHLEAACTGGSIIVEQTNNRIYEGMLSLEALILIQKELISCFYMELGCWWEPFILATLAIPSQFLANDWQMTLRYFKPR